MLTANINFLSVLQTKTLTIVFREKSYGCSEDATFKPFLGQTLWLQMEWVGRI